MLKDDGVREPAKHKAVERIIGSITSEAFNRLVNFGKAINDFVTDGGAAESVCARASMCLSVHILRMDERCGVCARLTLTRTKQPASLTKAWALLSCLMMMKRSAAWHRCGWLSVCALCR